MHFSEDRRKFTRSFFVIVFNRVSVFSSLLSSILYHTRNHNSVILLKQNVSSKAVFRIETINYRLELTPKCIISERPLTSSTISCIPCAYIILCCAPCELFMYRIFFFFFIKLLVTFHLISCVASCFFYICFYFVRFVISCFAC